MLIELMLAMMLPTATTPVAISAPDAIPAPDAASMTSEEVKAFNATVDKDHPYYIRCRSVKVTGSLAKRGRICRTSEEWARKQDHGNNEARTIVERSRAGMTSN